MKIIFKNLLFWSNKQIFHSLIAKYIVSDYTIYKKVPTIEVKYETIRNPTNTSLITILAHELCITQFN